jgi:hypothetical protein
MWRADDPDDLRYEDLWSDYLPTRVRALLPCFASLLNVYIADHPFPCEQESLRLLRNWAVAHQAPKLADDGQLQKPVIVYTLRYSFPLMHALFFCLNLAGFSSGVRAIKDEDLLLSRLRKHLGKAFQVGQRGFCI